MTQPSLLTVEGLEVVYQRSIVGVQDIALEVRAEGIVAILGSNGAGKTTTLRAISGFIGLDNARVTRGSVTFMGKRIENTPPHRITQQGIVIVPEREKIFPNLSVAENLTVAAPGHVGSIERRQLEHAVYDHFPRLGDLKGRTAGLLSGGERQMLAIGAALVCKPKLLLIDELSLGLAPVIVDDLAHRLVEVRRELGMTILLVEQSAAVALRIADYGYVLENGRVAFQGSAETLKSDTKVQEFYLGTSGGERRSYSDIVRSRTGRRESHAA
jgi:branched-chain amino acid transport system ATP-binding protein